MLQSVFVTSPSTVALRGAWLCPLSIRPTGSSRQHVHLPEAFFSFSWKRNISSSFSTSFLLTSCALVPSIFCRTSSQPTPVPQCLPCSVQAQHWRQFCRYSLPNPPKQWTPPPGLLPAGSLCSWRLAPQELAAGPHSAAACRLPGSFLQNSFPGSLQPGLRSAAERDSPFSTESPRSCQSISPALASPSDGQSCLPAYQLLLSIRCCPQTGLALCSTQSSPSDRKACNSISPS